MVAGRFRFVDELAALPVVHGKCAGLMLEIPFSSFAFEPAHDQESEYIIHILNPSQTILINSKFP